MRRAQESGAARPYARRISPAALALAAAAVWLLPGLAGAEPVFAQREGYKCARCHVNRTGGGKRTLFGYQWARTHLSIYASNISRSLSRGPARPEHRRSIGTMLNPQLNDYVAVGANLRLSNTTRFAKKVHNSFENSEANFYLELSASPLLDGLTLYADVSLAEGSVEARETFLLLPFLGHFYVKAGYFLLPYGLRIWGDEEYVRKETGYNYASPDLGLELGFDSKYVSVFFAASNGTGGVDTDNYKKLSLLAELTLGRFRVGFSGGYNESNTQTRLLSGLHLGLTLGRFTFLAEADLLTNIYQQKDATVHTLLAYGEGNLLILRGLNLKVSYGFHDPALDIPENHRMSVRGALEIFPLPMVATSVSYTFRQSVPQDEVGNADVLMLELHAFL